MRGGAILYDCKGNVCMFSAYQNIFENNIAKYGGVFWYPRKGSLA